MTEVEYKELISEEQATILAEPGKNRLFIQALDVSGSMHGQPLACLKEACLQLGERYYGTEQPAFEKLITIAFDHTIEEVFTCSTHQEYKKRINDLDTMGGTDFVPVMR